MAMLSFNGYFANEWGKRDGLILLESIKNDKYLDNANSAIIKATGESVYSLNCDTSSCFIIRKDKNNKLQFEFIDNKSIFFRT